MKLHSIVKPESALTKRRRVGRGPGSGFGKTSGRGEKGQKARSGYSHKRGFEGGQLPLYRRLPHRGFKNALFKVRYCTVNLNDLDKFENGTAVTLEILKNSGLIKDTMDGLKILGNGTLTKKLEVKAHKFTKTAKEAIEKQGGKAEVI